MRKTSVTNAREKCVENAGRVASYARMLRFVRDVPIHVQNATTRHATAARRITMKNYAATAYHTMKTEKLELFVIESCLPIIR